MTLADLIAAIDRAKFLELQIKETTDMRNRMPTMAVDLNRTIEYLKGKQTRHLRKEIVGVDFSNSDVPIVLK